MKKLILAASALLISACSTNYMPISKHCPDMSDKISPDMEEACLQAEAEDPTKEGDLCELSKDKLPEDKQKICDLEAKNKAKNTFFFVDAAGKILAAIAR